MIPTLIQLAAQKYEGKIDCEEINTDIQEILKSRPSCENCNRVLSIRFAFHSKKYPSCRNCWNSPCPACIVSFEKGATSCPNCNLPICGFCTELNPNKCCIHCHVSMACYS